MIDVVVDFGFGGGGGRGRRRRRGIFEEVIEPGRPVSRGRRLMRRIGGALGRVARRLARR